MKNQFRDFCDDLIRIGLLLKIPFYHLTFDMYKKYGEISINTITLMTQECGNWEDLLKVVKEYILPEQEEFKELIQQDDSEKLNNLRGMPTIEEDITVPKRYDITSKNGDTIVFIPDIHSPFHSASWLLWVVNTIEDLASKVEGKLIVIQLGDATDQYSASKYDKCVQLNLKYELREALRPLTYMWELINALPCDVECYQLIGNHDTRLDKFIQKTCSALYGTMPSPRDILNFKNVCALNNHQDILTINTDITRLHVFHGWLNNISSHYNRFNESVVFAHLHTAGIEYYGNSFAMCCGCGIDAERFTFAYANTIQKKKYTLGLGIVRVIDGQFEPEFKIYRGER